jgi:hypothetical protein
MHLFKSAWLGHGMLAVCMLACTPDREDAADADSGAPPAPADQLSDCMRAVRDFCEMSCGCSSAPGSCVTRNATPSGEGFVALTWSDAADCEAAYARDWCGGGSQAPASISDCLAAVETLACSGGGAARPTACDPAPVDDGEVACSSDEQCPGSHCAKAQQAVGGNVFQQTPVATGRCATECESSGAGATSADIQRFCGSTCSPGGGSYCTLGWSCVNATCQCSIRSAQPELSVERCDRMDNDCNGVADDNAQTDPWCAEHFGAGYVCRGGSCQPETTP